METKKLKLEEKPAASSYPLQRSEQCTSQVLMKNDAISAVAFDDNDVSKRDYAAVPYAPTTYSPLTPVENARAHQFLPDQMPSSDMSHKTDISQFSSFPNRNIVLNAFGCSTNELPQQHKMWTKNMNDSHVETLPPNSVRGQTVDGLHMISQGGVKNKRNIVKPRPRQNPSDLAAFHAKINEENDGSTDLTFDAFQPKYDEQFGSFLTLGGGGNINDRLNTFDAFQRGVTRGSGTAAIISKSNTSFQTANGTFMGSMNPSISIVDNSPSIQNDASHIGGPYQDLSGWNFVSNSPRIPSNAGVGISPSSVLQHTQLGYPHHPAFHSNMNFSHDVAASNNLNSPRIPSNAGVGISPSSVLQHTQLGYPHHPTFHSTMNFSHDVAASNNLNFVNLGHHGFFNTYPSNPVVQGNNRVDFGENCAKNLSMASLLGRHNTQLAFLQQNQETGSGRNQFRELDSEGIQRKNLSMTDLSRHKTRQAFVQQSNEAVLLRSSSAEPSLIPHSPSFSVSESRIKHDRSGAAESKMDQSFQCFQGSSLKRGSIQPSPAAPRAQRQKRVIQSPSQLSNFATAINPSQPIAMSGPYPSSSSLSSTHSNPAVPQLPQQPHPTFPRLANAASLPLISHPTVPTRPHSAQPSLPTTFAPSSLPKNVHYPPPSPLNTSTHHIKCKDSNEIQPLGENCFLCKRDVSFPPEGPLLKPTNRPPVAVLPCGHAFHDQCLERITPPEQCKSPPCIPCAIDESQL